MKKFFIVVTSLLGGALLIVVGVFVWLMYTINAYQPAVISQTNPVSGEANVVSVPTSVLEGGVPLRDLPITEAQSSALDFAGIDTDTFVITPAMQSCAKEKLGDARFAEILSGAAPTTLETISLLPCLDDE